MPIFGICRGMQALTIAGEGTLVQDLIEARPDSLLQHHQTQARMETTHAVSVNPNSHLAKVLSEPTVMVNSFHHQAVAKVPRGYNVAARADDGTIEAIEDPLAPFKIGVQWHPEDLASSQKQPKISLTSSSRPQDSTKTTCLAASPDNSIRWGSMESLSRIRQFGFSRTPWSPP